VPGVRRAALHSPVPDLLQRGETTAWVSALGYLAVLVPKTTLVCCDSQNYLDLIAVHSRSLGGAAGGLLGTSSGAAAASSLAGAGVVVKSRWLPSCVAEFIL
jgi:hypothetical protein